MAEKIQTSEAFLEEVAEQISYRPLRPAIVSELQDHIDERIGEYQNEGCSKEQAEWKAVAAMGDPVVIGTELNAVRHVRSNPVLMVCILCLAVIGAFFFLTIFRCVFLIRGKLASCTAFNCAMILLVQAVLYIAGNLGYQYEYFTNLPLISEGKVSIVINMILLGFIFSAYRYDKVIDETTSYRVV